MQHVISLLQVSRPRIILCDVYDDVNCALRRGGGGGGVFTLHVLVSLCRSGLDTSTT